MQHLSRGLLTPLPSSLPSPASPLLSSVSPCPPLCSGFTVRGVSLAPSLRLDCGRGSVSPSPPPLAFSPLGFISLPPASVVLVVLGGSWRLSSLHGPPNLTPVQTPLPPLQPPASLGSLIPVSALRVPSLARPLAVTRVCLSP